MVGVVLWLLIVLLAAAAILAVAALCMPVVVRSKVDSVASTPIKFKVALFAGLATVFKSSEKSRPIPDVAFESEQKSQEPKRNTRKRKKAGSRFGAASYMPRILRAAPRHLSMLFSRITFNQVDADVEFGFPDPADTGVVFGVLSPVAQFLNGPSAVHIAMHPDFSRAKFQIRGNLTLRFTPVALLAPVFAFGWAVFISPRISRAFR